MIEQVTGHQFDYDKSHKILKISTDLTEIGAPPPYPGGAGAVAEVDALEGGVVVGGRVSPPPHAPSCFSSHRGSPPSPIRKFFSSIFRMCKDIQIRQREERKARRKDTHTLKLIS
jgi:hypothetical protein